MPTRRAQPHTMRRNDDMPIAELNEMEEAAAEEQPGLRKRGGSRGTAGNRRSQQSLRGGVSGQTLRDRTNRETAGTRPNRASKDAKAKGGRSRGRARSRAGGHR